MTRFLAILASLTSILLGATGLWSAPHDPRSWAFGGGFIVIGFAGIAGVLRARRLAEIEADGRHIASVTGKARYVYWAAGGLAAVMSVAGVFILAPVAIGFLIAAIRGTLREGKFGTSMLVLSEPVRRGVRLRGSIETGRRALLQSDAPFSVRLWVQKTTVHGRRGKSGPAGLEVVWSAEDTIDASKVQASAEGIVIPIDIAIAHDAPPTSSEGRITTSWQLDVKRSLPGVDYAASFRLLVD